MSDIEEEEAAKQYEVEQVLGHKIKKKTRIFRVRWKGYESSEDTWEPEANLETARETLDAYLKENNLPLHFDAQQIQPKNVSKQPSKRPFSTGKKNDDDSEAGNSDNLAHGSRRSDRVASSKDANNAKKSKLELAVVNRNKIMHGNIVPRWLEDGDDAFSNDGGEDNLDKNQDENEASENGRQDENFLSDVDASFFNEHARESPQPQMQNHADTQMDSNSIRKQMNAESEMSGIPTVDANGNAATGSKQKNKKETRSAGKQKEFHNENLTFTTFRRSPDTHMWMFIARNNKNLNEVELSLDDAIDANPRGVALFFSGIYTGSSNIYTIKKD